jgi:hypothetical protein
MTGVGFGEQHPDSGRIHLAFCMHWISLARGQNELSWVRAILRMNVTRNVTPVVRSIRLRRVTLPSTHSRMSPWTCRRRHLPSSLDFHAPESPGPPSRRLAS